MVLPSFCWLNLSLTPRFQIFRLFQISQPHKNISLSSFMVAITLLEAWSSCLIVCSALRFAKTAFVPLFQPIRSNNQINVTLLAGVFPRCFGHMYCCEFCLVGWIVRVCCAYNMSCILERVEKKAIACVLCRVSTHKMRH